MCEDQTMENTFGNGQNWSVQAPAQAQESQATQVAQGWQAPQAQDAAPEAQAQQNDAAGLPSLQAPPIITLSQVGIDGQGQLLSRIVYVSDNVRIFKMAQVVPATSTRDGWTATTIALQRKTRSGIFTFYLNASLKTAIMNALELI